MNTNNYICFDTETESLNLRLSRPWQLSYGVYENGQNILTVDDFIWWEDLDISPGAKEVTKFNYQRYKSKAQDPKVVWNKFAKYYLHPKYSIVGHNILTFDSNMISNLCRGVGTFHPWSEVSDKYIDTHLLCKAQKMGRKIDLEDFLKFQYKISNTRFKGKTNLTAMCKEYNIPVDETKTHDGAYDIHLNALLFEKIKYLLK